MLVLLTYTIAGLLTLFSLFVSIVWLPKEMHEAYRSAFLALAMAVEERQPMNEGHAQRVAELAVQIAKEMKLPDRNIRIIEYAALLHDIGKVSIPYLILNSHEKLSYDQQEQLKEHAKEGACMLVAANTIRGIAPLVLHHHQRYDELLACRALPNHVDLLEAQIIAVSNAMDSMLLGIGGFEKMSRPQAIGNLWQGSGVQYHPKVVEAVTRVMTKQGISNPLSELVGVQ